MAWMIWGALAVAAATSGPPALVVVRFDGNRAVSTAELQAEVKQLGPAISDADGLERLALRVTALYFDRGYLAVRVDDPIRAGDGALVVHVSEGDRYSVRAISFSGAWPRAEAALRATLRTRAGAVFCRADVAADLKKLSALAGGAAVTPLTRIDSAHHTIDLEFLIS
ncbi:MAG TPA: POTRA domain-containing protein [Polyangia bacterium]|nr:POTRA domain-containing protein [Polyangia bacterium]